MQEFTKEELANEEWRYIPQTDCTYKVSNLGRVMSIHNGPYLLKPQKESSGYLSVGIHSVGINRSYRIHKLVAMAFLGHTPCGYKITVDHIDGNVKNNRLCNLQLLTARSHSQKTFTDKNKTSKYSGVSWAEKSKIWRADIYVNGKVIYLGQFSNEEEAHRYYKSACKLAENGEDYKIKKKRVEFTSKYVGVYWNSKIKKWAAQVTKNGKKKYLGTFLLEKDAHIAVLEFKGEL